MTSDGQRRSKLINLLHRHPAAPIIIFVNLKADVEFLQDLLTRNGKSVTSYHGGKTQEQREKGLNALRNGQADVLVCTNVAARGIDIDGVAHVINYNAPGTIIDYVHRIGRTGRAGAKGMATTFVNLEKDEGILYDLKKYLLENEQTVPNELSNCVS